MRLELRERVPAWLSLLAPACALLATFGAAAALIAAAGAPVHQGFEVMLAGAIGSGFAINEMLTRATPLILTGLAVSVAFRARQHLVDREARADRAREHHLEALVHGRARRRDQRRG
ncbi:MAG: hypothetical protein ACKOGH_15900, partial [Alphaproteobacteria bacterium]